MRRFTETINEHTKYPDVRPVKGLTLIHLFNKVWRLGGIKWVEGKRHSVIYSPEDKEYHVWGKDVLSFYSNPDDPDGHYFNKPDPARVKIYILTSILDERSKWCFDLKSKPEAGKLVKVVYNNGTIKNITFSGEWEPIEIPHNYHIDFEKEGSLSDIKVTPVCYRLS